MHTRYYWASQTPTVDLTQYGEDDEGVLFEDLRYTLDRWSFKISVAAFDAWNNQVYEDFGYEYLADANGDYYISYVYDSSPADGQGLRRGMKILAVDDGAVTAETLYYAGDTHTLTLLDDGQTVTVTLSASEYTTYGVWYNLFTSTDGKKVGYLSFKEFAVNSVDALSEAFTYFQEQGISDLILDLRYNGGGSVDLAGAMASLVRSGLDGSLQFTLRWNDQYSDQNVEYYYDTFTESLTMDRVYVITTENTASASELLISALMPYVDVVLVGSTTHGKPVGMQGVLYSDQYYFLINFAGYNVNGYGEYFDGIPVTCAADDDIAHDGVEEASIATALAHTLSGECTGAVGFNAFAAAPRAYGYTPSAASRAADPESFVRITPDPARQSRLTPGR